MAKPRITTHPYYRGNYWAIVLGPKLKGVIPCVLMQFVRTKSKREMVKWFEKEYPGKTVRAIRQPIPPDFEPGM